LRISLIGRNQKRYSHGFNNLNQPVFHQEVDFDSLIEFPISFLKLARLKQFLSSFPALLPLSLPFVLNPSLHRQACPIEHHDRSDTVDLQKLDFGDAILNHPNQMLFSLSEWLTSQFLGRGCL
jgi:hypothetical protein